MSGSNYNLGYGFQYSLSPRRKPTGFRELVGPEAGLGEITRDLLEERFWTTSVLPTIGELKATRVFTMPSQSLRFYLSVVVIY